MSTICGVFSDPTSAKRAVSDLLVTGIDRSAIRFVDDEQRSTMASEGREEPGFWQRLFGWDDGVSHHYDSVRDRFDESERYASSLPHGGREVVMVEANGRADEVRRILEQNGARVDDQSSRLGAAADEIRTMVLHEERLIPNKEKLKTGEVSVRKEVVTEHQEIEVPVTREEVVIERRSLSGDEAARTSEGIRADDLRPGEEIRIPVTEERVEFEKKTVAREEVQVGKKKIEETQRASGDLKKEKARVERDGRIDVRDDRSDHYQPSAP